MRRATVGNRPCAACAARTEVPDPADAYLAGVVLGAVNGQPFLEYEMSSLCDKHRKVLETQIAAIAEAEQDYFRGQS